MPANAFGASANIFEVLVDVDAKFAKIAEKEYGSVSSEVKKWFKKLAVRLFSNVMDWTEIRHRKRKRLMMNA
jgi:hypothetical protein